MLERNGGVLRIPQALLIGSAPNVVPNPMGVAPTHRSIPGMMLSQAPPPMLPPASSAVLPFHTASLQVFPVPLLQTGPMSLPAVAAPPPAHNVLLFPPQVPPVLEQKVVPQPTGNDTAAPADRRVDVQPLLQEASVMRVRNKITDAIQLYDTILGLDPMNVEALNCKGMCFKQLGDNVKAMALYDLALKCKSNDWCAHNNRGVVFKEMGLLQEAIDAYTVAIQCFEALEGPTAKSKPCVARANLAIALTDLGTQLKMAGKTKEAIIHYQGAISLHAEYATTYFNLGVVLSEIGQFDKALECYQLAVERQPNYVEALCNIGVIYKNRGALELAVEFYSRALKINPNFQIASTNLAIACTDLGTKLKNEGQVECGMKQYKRALVNDSKYPDAWYNLGVAYAEQDKTDNALVCYEMAIAFNPNFAQAHNNLGIIYKDRGNMRKSIHHYQLALQANPTFAQTLNNLGVIFTMLGKLSEAYAYCERAIQTNPTYAEAFNNLGVLLRDEGRIVEAMSSYEHCLKLDPQSRNAGQNKLLAMLSLPGTLSDQLFAQPEALQGTQSAVGPSLSAPAKWKEMWWGCDFKQLLSQSFKEHREWGNKFCLRHHACTRWPNDTSDPARVLRVGYLSADFFTHSVSYFIEGPLRFANPEEVEVVCYSNVAREDAKTEHLKSLTTEWRSVFGKSTEDVCAMISADRIDILVELTGHTSGNRLDVMACKPAPLQVSWIGYANTTGLPTIDYRLTDAIVDPVETKQQFVERLVRLPGPFLCYTPSPDASVVGSLPALKLGFITFGSFNNLAKVNERVLALWAAVLRRVANSHILLKAKPFMCANIREKMFRRFEMLGIPRRRVDLVPLLPTAAEHLNMYGMVDISLDTAPYAGTTTTCEALYMGVPVITLQALPPKSVHAHNVGVSILSRIRGCSDFITRSPAEFIETAVALANDRPRLTALRASLRENMLNSALCDGPGFTQGLENAYREMWRHYCCTREESSDAESEAGDG